MREECPQYALQFGRWFATCAFPETLLRAEMKPAMLRVRVFDLHYILCYIEKLSCQETWWAPGDMMSKKAACFAVEINIKCPRSSVGRARDPGPCGRGFERHGGRSCQILRLCLAVLLAGLLGCDVLARCPTLPAAAKEIMPVNLF